jgi:hypothetical protein
MKKHSLAIRILPFVLIAGVGAFFAAFHMTGGFSTLAERDAAARKNPKFWSCTTPVDGSSNLYALEYDLFSGKPYNDAYLFGSDILLVGEACYEDVLDEALSDSSQTDPVYEYSFELYSPWRNLILRTLPHQTIDCDRYQVVGDTLFLFNDSRREVSLYDSALKLIQTYDISSLYDRSSLSFSATEEPLVFLTYDEQENCFLQVDFSGESVGVQEYDSPYYGTVCGGTSPSGGRLALSGIDPATLGYRLAVLDSDSMELLEEYPGCSSFNGAVSDQAFLGRTNETENYWVYQFSEDEPVYFQLENARQVYLLPDGSFILVQENYEYASDDYVVSYSRYDEYGGYLSSFSYSCGDYNSSDCTYLSQNLAYFPEEQLCFLLAYNVDCQPCLLVWDTTSEPEDGADLVFYSSEEALALATPSLYYPLYEEQTGTDYGYEVTLLDEPSDYEWGTLSEANEKAQELENAYGISIYIGPEVPEMIDYFSIEQRLTPSRVLSALEDLDAVLSCYPKGFFSQLCFGENRGIRIYLSGTISGDGNDVLEEPSGFVNEINSYMVMVLDINSSWNWDYTINHEFSHMIDRRLAFRSSYKEDALFSEETWADYNPADFAYLESYDGYDHYTGFASYEEYFIDSYGVTFATEDRAELFGTAMSDYQNAFEEDGYFKEGTPTAEKYKYYCACIREGFDTTGWDSVAPWENVLGTD